MNGARPGSDSVARPGDQEGAGQHRRDLLHAAVGGDGASSALRDTRNPAIRNSAAVEMPWLTMYSVEPDWPWLVITKMPRMMKPKCEIEV